MSKRLEETERANRERTRADRLQNEVHKLRQALDASPMSLKAIHAMLRKDNADFVKENQRMARRIHVLRKQLATIRTHNLQEKATPSGELLEAARALLPKAEELAFEAGGWIVGDAEMRTLCRALDKLEGSTWDKYGGRPYNPDPMKGPWTDGEVEKAARS